ncbi:MAG: hypothetical protein ACOC0M_05865 [Halomonas sp.]
MSAATQNEMERLERVNREQQLLLDQVWKYVDQQGLAKLGQSKTMALIGAHQQAVGERVDAQRDRELMRRGFHRACDELSELKAALVEPGEAVPIGPAVSLVKRLKGARDALAAQKEDLNGLYEALCDARREERDAAEKLALYTQELEADRYSLAAHVERLRSLGWRAQNRLALSGESAQVQLSNELAETLEETPTTSLARRDLLKQAEVLEQLAEEADSNPAAFVEPGCIEIESLNEHAAKLRRQAEEKPDGQSNP